MALLKMAQIALHRLHRPAEALQLFHEFHTTYAGSIWMVAAEDGMLEAQQAMAGPIVPGILASPRPTGPGVMIPGQVPGVAPAAPSPHTGPTFFPGVPAAPHERAR